MNEMPSSILDEAESVIQTNRDGGDNFANVGLGTMNNYKAVRDMHFGGKE
jgi:hypothetical protein